jgi:hypothetical protein
MSDNKPPPTERVALSWTFGQLEAALSQVHDVGDDKRTSFQARLKNFHRLGFPRGFASVKGKASRYDRLHVYDMALAIEMTQLGLAPEQVVQILLSNQPVAYAAFVIAADNLLGWINRGRPVEHIEHAYLYFDPTALKSLSKNTPSNEAAESFFFGTLATVTDLLRRPSKTGFRRMSVINVTKVVDSLFGALNLSNEEQVIFLRFIRGGSLENYVSAENSDDKVLGDHKLLAKLGRRFGISAEEVLFRQTDPQSVAPEEYERLHREALIKVAERLPEHGPDALKQIPAEHLKKMKELGLVDPET